jgi:hypothetical protein
MADSWYVAYHKIDQHNLPGMYLGRNVRHDSRNLRYAWPRTTAAPVSKMWTRHGDILDQGNLGSCIGNAETGALECDPCYGALPAAHPVLDESLAVTIYSAAEKLDGGAGYPPEDEGSTGPSAAQAAKNMGLVSGYLHCFGLADVLDALQAHPVCIGASWFDSFDSPDSSGLIAISPGAQVRGGHEFLCRGLDVDEQLLFFDNSWGAGWGKAGSFSMAYATLDRLLGEQGDATISLPATVPAPTPVPVPTPVPTPVPGPDDADLVLYRGTSTWAGEHHMGQAKAIAGDLRTWYAAKGLS